MLKTLRRANWDWLTILRGLAIALAAVALGQLIAVASQNGLPLLRERSLVFVFLLVPILLAVFLLLARADVGFGLVVILATLAISKTGFQIDLGPIRTSALEVLIILSSPILLLRSRFFSTAPRWPALVIGKPWLAFALLSIPALLIAALRGISWSNALWEYKGYFLYPFLTYIMVGWITTERR